MEGYERFISNLHNKNHEKPPTALFLIIISLCYLGLYLYNRTSKHLVTLEI